MAQQRSFIPTPGPVVHGLWGYHLSGEKYEIENNFYMTANFALDQGIKGNVQRQDRECKEFSEQIHQQAKLA